MPANLSAEGRALMEELSFAHRDGTIEYVESDKLCHGAWAVNGIAIDGGPLAALIVFLVNNAKALLDAWEERDRLSDEVGRLGEALELLGGFVAMDEEAAPNGLMDCVDRDGSPYQSEAMAGIVAQARLLARPYDHAKALAEYRATLQTGDRG